MLEINFCDPPIPFLNIQGASEEIEMYILQITDGEQVIRKALVLVSHNLRQRPLRIFKSSTPMCSFHDLVFAIENLIYTIKITYAIIFG